MIIFICGTSSSGKSSVCSALKQNLADNWLLFGMDAYLGMLGDKFNRLHPANAEVCVPNQVVYAKRHADGSFEIITGALVKSLFSTIPAVLSALAEGGFNIIVDSLISNQVEMQHFKNKLCEIDCRFVFLAASEHEINRRERKRGDRLLGSAIHWLNAFDIQHTCEIIFDTEMISVDQIAADIIQRLKIPNKNYT